ncbi:hypothetical protein D3C71_1489080 [compost metagenome]
MLDQTVITTAGTHRTLSAQTGGYPFEYRTVVVVQTAHQAFIDGIWDTCLGQKFTQAFKVGFGFFIQILGQARRIVQQCLHFRVFGVQHAQRVAVHAAFAIFVQLVLMLFQERHQSITVIGASFQ